MPASLTERRARRFWVVWQDPESRAFYPVAQLDATDEGEFRFRCLPEAPLAPGFRLFAAFPDLDHEYRSDELFPFFTNHVMSARRPDFEAYLSALGLTREDGTPLQVLARSAGERATDSVKVVAEPVIAEGGHERLVFPVSGVQHMRGAPERIARLVPGQRLIIRPEPENPRDSRALLLDASAGEPVGWVPAYRLDCVHGRLGQGADVRAFVEQANGPETPWPIRLMCRLEVWPSAAQDG